MEQITVIGITGALTEVVKRIGVPEKYTRYVPLLAIVIGIGVAFFLLEGHWKFIIVQGLIAGLASTGFYSGGKKVVQGIKK